MTLSGLLLCQANTSSSGSVNVAQYPIVSLSNGQEQSIFQHYVCLVARDMGELVATITSPQA